MKKILLVLAASLMLVANLGATTLLGDPVLLSELPNGELLVGDKLFTNFDVNCVAFGTNTCVDETAVTVQGIIENGHYGIRFQGPFVALDESLVDYVISFNVDVTDPTKKIIAIGARFNGEYEGDGTSEIVEDAFDGVQVGQLKVSNPPEVLTATFGLVNPYPGGGPYQASSLFIQKDMLLTAVDGVLRDGDKASVSIIDQWFVQTGEIPEPGTYAMMGAGLLALAAIRRRKA